MKPPPALPHRSHEHDRLVSGSTSVRVSKLTLATLKELQSVTMTGSGYRSYHRQAGLDELLYRLARAALDATE